MFYGRRNLFQLWLIIRFELIGYSAQGFLIKTKININWNRFIDEIKIFSCIFIAAQAILFYVGKQFVDYLHGKTTLVVKCLLKMSIIRSEINWPEHPTIDVQPFFVFDCLNSRRSSLE